MRKILCKAGNSPGTLVKACFIGHDYFSVLFTQSHHHLHPPFPHLCSPSSFTCSTELGIYVFTMTQKVNFSQLHRFVVIQCIIPNFRCSKQPVYHLQQTGLLFSHVSVIHVPSWLAQWQPFCYKPYQRMQPVLIVLALHPLFPCGISVLCLVFHLSVESFPIRSFCLLHPYPCPHRIPPPSYLLWITHLFISWFLLVFSYSFSTYIILHALFLSFLYKHVSKMMHSTWPTASLFSLNSTVLSNESNLKTFAAFFTPFLCVLLPRRIFLTAPISLHLLPIKLVHFSLWNYQLLCVHSFPQNTGYWWHLQVNYATL